MMLAQPSWSYITEISEQKEDLATAMAGLSINEGGSLTQTCEPPCAFLPIVLVFIVAVPSSLF
jgi:hypothetical protein